MRLFLFLAFVSPVVVAQPLQYQVCDYYRGQFICRDFDPRTDGRRADAVLARYNPPPAATTPLPSPPKTVVEVVSETPAVPPASALPPESPTIPSQVPTPVVAPVVSPSRAFQLGPYIPVQK